MSGDAAPRIACTLTFLTPEEGGRSAPLRRLAGGTYRPHLLLDGVAEPGDRDYLGVAFISGPARLPILGESLDAEFVCLYHPQVDYSALKPGVTFRLVEGTRVVAQGFVRDTGLRPPTATFKTRRVSG